MPKKKAAGGAAPKKAKAAGGSGGSAQKQAAGGGSQGAGGSAKKKAKTADGQHPIDASGVLQVNWRRRRPRQAKVSVAVGSIPAGSITQSDARPGRGTGGKGRRVRQVRTAAQE